MIISGIAFTWELVPEIGLGALILLVVSVPIGLTDDRFDFQLLHTIFSLCTR